MSEALPRKTAAGRITEKNKLRTGLQIEAIGASIDKVVFIFGTKGGWLFRIIWFTLNREIPCLLLGVLPDP